MVNMRYVNSVDFPLTVGAHYDLSATLFDAEMNLDDDVRLIIFFI